MQQRFLDPSILAGISGLDLVAKTVVDSFVAGLHRFADFVSARSSAEYRAYNPGDDLRHVNKNIYSRTERLLSEDASRRNQQRARRSCSTPATPCSFGSHRVNKIDTPATLPRPSSISPSTTSAIPRTDYFDDESATCPPLHPQGQLHRLIAALEQAKARARTDFAKPMRYFQEFLKRRGIVLIVSDF